MKIRITICLSILFSANLLYGQITFPISKDTSLLNWKAIEKKPSNLLLDKFLIETTNEFEFYYQKDADFTYPTVDSLKKCLHFIDLNNDGREDVIFEGQNGAEAQQVHVFINTNNGYKMTFSTMQGVIKMDFKNNKLSKLYIDDWGCCDAYILFHKIYEVTYTSSNLPVFKQIYQGACIEYGNQPKIFLDQPYRFEVLNEGYKIRYSPIIDDTSFERWSSEKPAGNTIGKLPKGAIGTALGRSIDKTGREWLYVEIDEPFFPKNDILYLEEKFPTKLIGWISSRFINKL